jgi:multiple antibiotic resistance protein
VEAAPDHSLLAAKLFPLLFNMMGPIGLIPAFAHITAGMDQPTRNRMARRAAGLAFIALLLAVFLGAAMLGAWSISKGSLLFAAGLIVTGTALLPLLWPGGGAAPAPAAATKQTPEQLAVSPLPLASAEACG